MGEKFPQTSSLSLALLVCFQQFNLFGPWEGLQCICFGCLFHSAALISSPSMCSVLLLPLRVSRRVGFGDTSLKCPTSGLPLFFRTWEHQPSLQAPVAGAVSFYSLPGAWSEIMNGFIGNQLPIHKCQPGSASCSHPSQRGLRAGSRTATYAVNKDGCFTHTS